MLKLTRTESVIVEALKEGPKTDMELEEIIDRAKEFSRDYIKVMIFKINKKRKIIDTFMREGQKYYRLMETEDNLEYQILEGVADTLDELVSIKVLMCDTCAFKANVDTAKKVEKMHYIVAGIGAVACILIGYIIGLSFADIYIQVDGNELKQLVNTTTSMTGSSTISK